MAGTRVGRNRHTASCAVQGAALTVSPVASTRMMCGEEKMALEARYFRALAAARRYERDGDERDGDDLILHTNDGAGFGGRRQFTQATFWRHRCS